MHLAIDYVHPFRGPAGARSQCRVRIYVPDEEGEALGDAPVVVCSELANNPGTSITNAAEQLAAEVIKHHKLLVPIWIEHYPPESTDGRAETFDLVVFGHHEAREIVRGGVLRTEIGPPTWKRLDRESVEVLVGQQLD